MNIAQRMALCARVSTNDKGRNPETQLRPLRAHVEDLPDVTLVGTFVDLAGARQRVPRACAWRPRRPIR